MQPTKHNIFKDEKQVTEISYREGKHIHKTNGVSITVEKIYGKYALIKSPHGLIAKTVDYLNDFEWIPLEKNVLH